jgi:hypothetical protein
MSRDQWTSISAIENAGGKFGEGGCFRRWWLDKCIKLPQPKKRATVFGDVHHAVLARFYTANDRGLDVIDNRPVNLYPNGWMTMKEKFGANKNKEYTIEPTEAALIQILVEAAIMQGVIVREPGRVIERPLGDDLGEQGWGRILCREGRAKAVLKGFIDLETPKRIEDHKTAKSTDYILSNAKLRQSIQMMTYALDKYERGHKDNLFLAHNNFIKDFDRPQVIKREIEVTEAEVYQFYSDVTLPIVKKMFQIYMKYPKEKVNSWRDVPPPNNPSKECNYYYGKPCPYILICTGSCSVSTYLLGYGEKIDGIEPESSNSNSNNSQKGSKKMNSLLERIKAQQADMRVTGTAPVVTSPVQVVPVSPAPVTTSAVGGNLANIMARFKSPGQAAESAITPPVVALPPVIVTPPQVITVPPNTVVVQEQPAPADTPRTEKQVAPWYVLYQGQPCPACKDNNVPGYNSKMSAPCQVCDARAKNLGIPTSSDYDVDVVDGKLVFTLKAGKGVTPPLTVAKSAGTKVQVEQPKPIEQPKPLTQGILHHIDAGIEPAVLGLVNQTPVSKEDIQKKEQQFKSEHLKMPEAGHFTLLLGCMYFKGDAVPPETIVSADDILKASLDYIAEVAGKPVAEVEHFQLMAALDAYIPQIAEKLDGFTVMSFAPTKGSALARLIDGLRPYATSIIVPIGI